MRKEQLVREHNLKEKLRRLKRSTYLEAGLWVIVSPLYILTHQYIALVFVLIIETLIFRNYQSQKYYLLMRDLSSLLLDELLDKAMEEVKHKRSK